MFASLFSLFIHGWWRRRFRHRARFDKLKTYQGQFTDIIRREATPISCLAMSTKPGVHDTLIPSRSWCQPDATDQRVPENFHYTTIYSLTDSSILWQGLWASAGREIYHAASHQDWTSSEQVSFDEREISHLQPSVRLWIYGARKCFVRSEVILQSVIAYQANRNHGNWLRDQIGQRSIGHYILSMAGWTNSSIIIKRVHHHSYYVRLLLEPNVQGKQRHWVKFSAYGMERRLACGVLFSS